MNEEIQSSAERQKMSRKEVAKYLGICVGTLRTLDIPCAKVGRRLVYFRDSVNKWLYAQEEERKGKKRKQTPKAAASAETTAGNPKQEAGKAKSNQSENELFEGAENAKQKS